MPRRKRRFPFSLDNGHGTYYFKCDTELKRYTWIFCILLASTGKAPKPVPRSIPKNFLESVTNPRMAKFEKKIANSNSKLETQKTEKADKMGSEHRIKYAKRLETRARRYSSQSEDSKENDNDEIDEQRRPLSARSVKTHERNQRKISRENGYQSYRGSTSDIRQLRRTSSHSSIEIHAQMHSPSPTRASIGAAAAASFPVADSMTPVLKIVEIEDDEHGTVHVISRDHSLPNMIVDDINDSRPLSARTSKNNHLQAPGRMTHSHSMTDLGQTNLGMNIDDEHSIIGSFPKSRSRVGQSGMPSPQLNTKKQHTNTASRKPGQKHYTKKEDSPRSPVQKSRYSRYNIPSSEA